MSSKVDNPDLIALAVYELGGIGCFVDVEDIFVRCYEMAPERFGWRKYPYPNYKNVYHALQHFEENHLEVLLKTPDGLARQLSAEGIAYVRKRLRRYQEILKRPGANPPTRRPTERLLNEFSSHRLTKAGHSRVRASKLSRWLAKEEGINACRPT